MRKIETTIYDYDDMVALREMTPKEVIEVLKYAYRGYINKYTVPDALEEYNDADYYNYKLQCAFNLAYEYLKKVEKDEKDEKDD